MNCQKCGKAISEHSPFWHKEGFCVECSATPIKTDFHKVEAEIEESVFDTGTARGY